MGWGPACEPLLQHGPEPAAAAQEAQNCSDGQRGSWRVRRMGRCSRQRKALAQTQRFVFTRILLVTRTETQCRPARQKDGNVATRDPERFILSLNMDIRSHDLGQGTLPGMVQVSATYRRLSSSLVRAVPRCWRGAFSLPVLIPEAPQACGGASGAGKARGGLPVQGWGHQASLL